MVNAATHMHTYVRSRHIHGYTHRAASEGQEAHRHDVCADGECREESRLGEGLELLEVVVLLMQPS
jgi:hypothetical protein